MKNNVLILLLFVSLNVSSQNPQNQLWNLERLEMMVTNSMYKGLVSSYVKKANEQVKDSTVSVTEKIVSVSGDKHNYESLASYHWPNPIDPDGPYILKDGKLNPEVNGYDRPRINYCADLLRRCALTYYFSHDDKFFNLFSKQINRWFVDKETLMYPTMNYSQIIKGYNNNKGNSQGIIDSFVIVDVLESVCLVNSIKPLDSNIMSGLKKWCTSMLRWLQESKLGKEESSQDNNHGIAYDELCLALALFVDNKEISNSILIDFPKKRLEKQIHSDGSLKGERKRTKSYYYSVYNLTHIVDICIMAHNNSIHLLKENSTLINKCVEYLYSFVNNQESYPYKEIGDWKPIENSLLIEIDRLKSLARLENVKLTISIPEVSYFGASINYTK